MQINSFPILNRSQLVALESTPATSDRAGTQQRLRQANDSYNKNAASAQVIDAEYVDLYSAENKSIRKTQDIDVMLATNAPEENRATQSLQQLTTGKYQLQDPDTPPPGTYINYFA